jgi:dinuclear metal center YbgI/SA1388 family protein
MKIAEIIETIEDFAPLSYQETYDNAGLIVGDKTVECTGIIICLDAVESVIDEAIAAGCNLVVAHHPIIFSGLKKITGKNYIERTIIKAIKNDIAIYASHTNLDNIRYGVNHRIADKLGLTGRNVLEPKKGVLKKLYTYVPEENKESLLNALFGAGAGNIGNYAECSFSVGGTGTFKGNEQSNPKVGERLVRSRETEQKVEVIYPQHLQSQVLKALFDNHPYEEVAYEILSLDNMYQDIGSGMTGTLESPMDEKAFLSFLKRRMHTGCIRHTRLLQKPVQKVAICGGAGSFLLQAAIHAGADIFITADFKYHQFFDADNRIVIADIGHYESEQFTAEIFFDLLTESFPNIHISVTKQPTNPVLYF